MPIKSSTPKTAGASINSAAKYQVVLFNSVSYALKSEKLLKNHKIPLKLIPVPKKISSNCGVCIRFEARFEPEIRAILDEKWEFKISPL